MKKFLFILLCAFFASNCALASSVNVKYNDNIYHIILSKDIGKRLKFVVSEQLITNREAHQRTNSLLTVNAGFFDPKNGKTVSYIMNEGEIIADPLLNESLFANKFLNRNLKQILDRSEFRVLKCQRRYLYEIVPHSAPIQSDCELITSAQGGPLILPNLHLEEELFLVKDENGEIIRESCSVLHKVARTVIGLKDGNIHILIITDKHPMDLYEVRDLCIKLGLDSAMAFDGGSSTSMNYKNKTEVISTVGDGGGRKLKSFMIIKK